MIGLTVTSTLGDASAALRQVADGLPDRLEETVTAATGFLETELKASAPVSKPTPGSKNTPGGLRNSIRGEASGLTGTFTAVNYVEWVIGGADPHTITGNPVLSFYWDKAGGQVVFASVHHPGNRPNDFRVEALAEAADQAEDELDALGDWVAEQLAG